MQTTQNAGSETIDTLTLKGLEMALTIFPRLIPLGYYYFHA